MARRKEPVTLDAILDQLLAGTDAKAAFDSNSLIDQLRKALAERALNAERDHYLPGDGLSGNSRNGYGKKTVLTDDGSLELSIPRDRHSSFDPQLLAKYQRRFPGFDDKIISMYARGMSTREITGHIQDVNGGAKAGQCGGVKAGQRLGCGADMEMAPIGAISMSAAAFSISVQ